MPDKPNLNCSGITSKISGLLVVNFCEFLVIRKLRDKPRDLRARVPSENSMFLVMRISGKMMNQLQVFYTGRSCFLKQICRFVQQPL